MGCFVLREWPLQLSRESRVIKTTRMAVREAFIYIDIYMGMFYILYVHRAQMAPYRSEAA